MECQGCYIFEMDKKREVRIDQLDFAPLDWMIRAYEERGMRKYAATSLTCHTAEQTIYVMLQSSKKPTKIKDMIINGQHSVSAS